MFQDHHVIGGDVVESIPFVHTFLCIRVSLILYNHDGDVNVIPSTMSFR
jgi:hypothetical protein